MAERVIRGREILDLLSFREPLEGEFENIYFHEVDFYIDKIQKLQVAFPNFHHKKTEG